MGINTLFNIGETAVTAQRMAIEVTSQNIANVNTAGYSRQRAILQTAPIVNSGGFPLGSGVQIAAVQRSYDGLLQQQIINGNSTSGKDSALLSSLQQIEPSFNEVMTDGLGQAIEDYFNSWQDLSVNPQGSPERQALLSRSQVLVDTFHQMNSSLGYAVSSADNNLTGITADVTDKAKNIASLNLQIKTTEDLGGNSNDLRDQRDYLLQQLATKVGFSSVEQADGTVTVSLAGGETLVSGSQYATLYTDSNGTNNDILITGLGNPPPANNPAADTDVTATVGGSNNGLGEIGGTLQIRDNIIGGTGGYLARLDELAEQVVTEVNTQHLLGYGLDGVGGRNFFNPANLTSASISLDPALTINTVAAAGPLPAPAPLDPGNNVNALKMAGLKTDNTISFTVNAVTTVTSFSSYFSSFVSNVGIDVQGAKNADAQNKAFLRQLNSLRESNAGVSLDEELTNLMKYQRGFEAAAKTINAATEMLDTVLGLVR